MPDGEYKICNPCGVSKPLHEFYRRANKSRTGKRTTYYSFRCKICDRAAARAATARYRTRNENSPLPDSRRCSTCGVVKPASVFGRNASRPDGLQARCSDCRREHRYGLGRGDYARIHEAQGGTCSICKNQCPRGFDLSVDHDHKTGRVRGLLCQNCNAGLGMFRDDPGLLATAIEYLRVAS